MHRNVLVFHAGALGDTVLAVPLALALTRLYPTSRVRWVAGGQKAELMARLAGVEPVDVEGGFSPLFAEGADVRAGVARLLGQTHRVVSFVAEPEEVWTRRVRELAPEARLTFLRLRPPPDWRDPATGSRHAADHLVWQCGRPERGGDVALGEAVRQMRLHLSSAGVCAGWKALQDGPVVLHPGAGSPQKCWPLDRFRELALLLMDRLRRPVIWCLGEPELERMRPEERRALEALGELSVCPSLVGLLELLRRAAVLVGNDSGPGHLAATVGVPVVSLFGPTDPEVWQPLGPRVEVVRAPGGDLAALTAMAVAEAVGRVLFLCRSRLPSDIGGGADSEHGGAA